MKNLKRIRESKNLTQEALAKRVGVHPRTVSNWEQGFRKPNSVQRAKLCESLKITEAELFIENSHQLQIVEQNVVRVPVISWVHANQFADISDPFPVGVSDTYIYSSHRGKNMFALKIKNDCMENEFYEGEIINVEPTADVKHKDFVVVRDNNSKEATFKQLKIIGNKMYLHPLNPKYDDIPLDDERYEIIGKVVEKVKKY